MQRDAGPRTARSKRQAWPADPSHQAVVESQPLVRYHIQMAARKPPPSRAVRKKRLTARNADRHELYERAVQAPALDAAFYARWFEKYTGRPLRVLREDFCGTAVLACHHVKRHSENRAIGVDQHWQTLAWARMHNVKRLLNPEQQTRLSLLQKNVPERRRSRSTDDSASLDAPQAGAG